ncbi:uncharacterized protein JCM6883_004104 [Sporobolomyces salmoneus]|uniref:uncharacterized protein n=1 Tax=Sporobolomyces salmoneus TaxID=183962 RepID=UPI0031702412
MVQQLIFSSSTTRPNRELWCRTHADVWNGVDFDDCWRKRIFDGFIPALFLALSLLSLSIHLVRFLLRLKSRSKHSKKYLPIPSISENVNAGPTSAISVAENQVILKTVKRESPDWSSPATQKELLGSAAVVALDEEQIDEDSGPITLRLAARAVWGSKKDLLNVVGTGATVSLTVFKLVEELRNHTDGAGWSIVAMVAWSWTFLLSIAKFCLSFSHRLFALTHPDLPHRNLPAFYTTLERHVIPFFMFYSTLTAFFDLRTALIVFYDRKAFPSPFVHLILNLEASIFAVSTSLFVLELFAPRPSRFSSRSSKPSTQKSSIPPSPEMHASLISLATFSWLEPFQLRATFPNLTKSPPLTLETTPDLRPDDKTARVFLTYRLSLQKLDKLIHRLPSPFKRLLRIRTVEDLGLTGRLLYHFVPELLVQQLWSLVRVALTAAPPLCLQGILAHLARRQRHEESPTHVAVLYAYGLFITTIVGAIAASQGLYIGRRICIRLRSIIVSEAFTKALRRKDQAGSSVPKKEEDGEEVSKVEAPVKETKEEEEETELSASSGKIMNLISVDTYRVSEVCAYLHFLTTEMPLSIIVIVYLLFRLLGWSAIAGVAVLLILLPVQTQIAALYNRYQEQLLAAADARLTLATEVISQVRIVKYFAWESKFLEKMNETRRKELSALWKRALTMVLGQSVMFGAPVLVGASTFTFHTKVMKQDLTAETAFTALALFNVLRSPLESFSDMFVNVLQAYVSLKRIDKFLAEEETHKYSVLSESSSEDDPKVGFVDASFTWANEEDARSDSSVFRVSGLDFAFPEQSLSIILGPVGSGKTSLLMSLLGETNRLSGTAFLPSPVIRSVSTNPAILTDSTALATQQPFLVSASIRENILFGAGLNDSRYRAVLEACALNPDLKQFELGDDTEVGERGTVLSGGQKARISLARAIYSSAKYVLLDDVLSAVDSHTAQHLVEKCLTGKLMKHRTCILVTHSVELCLPYASFFVSMDNGAVVSSGSTGTLTPRTIQKLGQADDEERKMAEASAITIEEIAREMDEGAPGEAEEERKKKMEKLKLVKDETQSQGAVSGAVYLLYIRALGGQGPLSGFTWLLIIVGVYVLAQISDVAVSLALRYWAQSYDTIEASAKSLFVATIRSPLAHNAVESSTQHSPDFWLSTYCIIALISLVLSSARVAFFLWRGVCASKEIYRLLISKILGAKIRFFDSTPTGRILNRLSKDTETIDQDIASTGSYFVFEIFAVISIILTISFSLPAFLPAAAFISLLYWLLGLMYRASSRELKRTESVTKSPIFSLFGEALSGVSTIRAYGDGQRFMEQIFSLLDQNNRPFFVLWGVNRWLSIRVDAYGALVALLSALFIIFAPRMDPSLAGFIMSFALAFQDRILWVVRLFSTMEVNANSLERVQEYTLVEQESQGGVAPPARWPDRNGSIKVKKLTASYAPELPPVLKEVSFEVKGGEKVGIVGRTGSGKSTLGLSFFRFIEPTSGCIEIDGQDINKLKLQHLRSALTIVAQDAALFAGTLRFNLDPFDQYEDSALWDVLHRVQMASLTAATPVASRPVSDAGSDEEGTVTLDDAEERFVVKSLSMEVKEGGKNFSAGQRQLLALARGMLKLKYSSSSILILDESTASLDHATDEQIQRTIRDEMSDATILCIAHRLRTIIDMDRVLVLDHGVVLEYDTPLNLLSNKNSSFAALCEKSGELEVLREMAEKKEASRDTGN